MATIASNDATWRVRCVTGKTLPHEWLAWFLPAPLATTRLVLRAGTDDDWPAYRRTLVEEPLRSYLGGPVAEDEADQRRAEVSAKGSVAVERNGQVVGFLLLDFSRADDVELSYCFLPEHQRHGYAREAVSALADWAFVMFSHLPRLIAVTEQANDRSVALLRELHWTETDDRVESGEQRLMFALPNTTLSNPTGRSGQLLSRPSRSES